MFNLSMLCTINNKEVSVKCSAATIEEAKEKIATLYGTTSEEVTINEYYYAQEVL